jgi:hypothetical protein
MLKDLLSFDMKKHPFNRAAKLFGQLRYYEMGSDIYMKTLDEIIAFCREALRRNKYDGDSHVLLANTYLLGMFVEKINGDPQKIIHNIGCCAAVIQEWKTNPAMYTKEKMHGEKIYNEVIVNIEEDWPKSNTLTIREFMEVLHDKYYTTALGIEET